MSVRSRTEGAKRTRRVYFNRGQRPAGTPLETLLQLIALKAESGVARDGERPRDEDLKEVISALYQVATGNFDRGEVLDLAARRALTMSAATGSALALKQGDLYVCCCRAGEHAPPVGACFDAASGISGECVRTAQILRCDNAQNDPRANAAVCRELGISSIVAVPVLGRGGVCGILEVFSARPSAFHQQHTHLLQLISALVGHVLQFERGPAAEELNVQSTTPQVELPEPALVEPHLTATIPGALQGWIEQPKGSPFLPTRFRIIAGLGASAVLFASLWLSILHNKAPQTTVAAESHKTAGTIADADAGAAPSPSVAARVSGIEVKSHGEFTAVRIRLSSPVRLHSGRLQHPDRIYFDLSDSDLGPQLGAQQGTTVEVNDAFISRIRASQAQGHSTRIVFDLNCTCDYTAVTSDSAPYDVSILVQPPHSKNGASLPTQQEAITGSLPTSATLGIPGRLTIVVDPGHGGPDLGTIGPDGSTEKDLVLDIARRLGTILTRNLGAQAVFTRADDRFVSLEERDRIANEARANLLISIHANSSSDRQTRGVETYYAASQPRTGAQDHPVLRPVSFDRQQSEAKRLATLVQRELYSALSRKDQNLRDRGVKKAQFVLLTNAGMPAVLTEVAFISSPTDERNLSRPETRDIVARGLFQAITGFARKQPLAAGL